jgi:hypothetical protein
MVKRSPMRTCSGWIAAVVVVISATSTVACVDKGPGHKRKIIDPEYIEEHLVSAVPGDLTNKIDADLGGFVVYAGNIVDKTTIAPGDKVRITHYWRVVAPPGDQWRVFSHVRGEGNAPDFMNVDETDMRTGHGPPTWKAGEIIEDVQDFALKPDWKSKTATLIVGMYQKGKHKLTDRMPVKSGPQIDSAVIAVKLTIDLAKAPPAPGTVVVKKATAPIAIDGVATDPAWTGAAASGDFVAAEGSGDTPGKSSAKLTWDDDFLYLYVQSADSDVFSTYKVDDEPLWKNDVVEIFIDADGNRQGYVELQANPNGAKFDSWFAGPRGPAGDVAWSSGMQAAVKVRGTNDNRDDTDAGWDVEFAIPWAAAKGKADNMPVRTPPAIGDKWKLNVVRVDYAKDQKNPTVASWNKITYQDFHALDRMLTVQFADAAGKTTPPAGNGSGSAAGSAAGSGSGSGSAIGSGSAAAPKIGPNTPKIREPRRTPLPGSAAGSGSGSPR